MILVDILFFYNSYQMKTQIYTYAYYVYMHEAISTAVW